MISEYLGKGTLMEDCDLLALKIAEEHRREELAAMQARWWDYRLLHPTEATYLFAEHYRQACSTWHERWVDTGTAEEARAFSPDDIFLSRDMTAMWLARQSADKLGVPYDYVMEFALKRGLARGFHRMLRPNQFYGEDFEIDLKADWAAWSAGSLRTPALAHYQVAQYQGTRLQREYREWLLAQVKSRPAPRHRLLARLQAAGMFTDAMIEAEFGAEVLLATSQYRALLSSQ